MLNFASNNYLSLANHPESTKFAAQYGYGAGASRLVTGNHDLYNKLETKLAKHKQTQATCIFGSGYLANLGAITSLVGKGDLVIADKLVHACIIDGCQLSGATFKRFKHNDLADLKRILKQRSQYKNCLVITESVFSMDGDLAPIKCLREICKSNNAWLMVDDAHGLYDKTYDVDVLVGTFSKALGAYGGYVAGSKTLVQYLKNTARSLIYTTALPPNILAYVCKVLDCIDNRPRQALDNAQYFTNLLGLPPAQHCIIPIILGDEAKVLAAQAKLLEQGIIVGAIRPPTVPAGTARLRISISAAHSREDINKLTACLKGLGFRD